MYLYKYNFTLKLHEHIWEIGCGIYGINHVGMGWPCGVNISDSQTGWSNKRKKMGLAFNKLTVRPCQIGLERIVSTKGWPFFGSMLGHQRLTIFILNIHILSGQWPPLWAPAAMLLLPSAKAQPLAAVHMGSPPDQAHAASGDHGDITTIYWGHGWGQLISLWNMGWYIL